MTQSAEVCYNLTKGEIMTKEEIFALKLKELRRSKNMTQKQLADMLCVSDKNLSKWECGRSTPDVFYLQEICKIFGVEAEYFFEDITLDTQKEKELHKKKLNFVIWRWIAVMLCLSSFALFISVVARIFLPTTIPAHYNGKGEIDRWGSSKEFVGVGITFCLLGYMAFFIKASMYMKGDDSIKSAHLAGAILLSIPLFTTIFMIVHAIKVNTAALDMGYAAQEGDTFASLFSAILCELYIVCGAICMGVKQNGIVGLRIPLTLENEKAWDILNRGWGLIIIIVSEITLVIVGLCDLLPVWSVIFLPFVPLAISLAGIPVLIKTNKKKFAD